MHYKESKKKQLMIKQYEKLYTVFDLEFYGVKPHHKFGNLKQIAVITFNEKYEIINVFDTTFIDEVNQREYILRKVDRIMSLAETNFAWGCHQDLKSMHDFGFDLSKYTIVDMQTPFAYHSKQNSLGGTYYKLTGKRMVGAHNALIDAQYTLKIMELLDLAKDGALEKFELYARYLLCKTKSDKEFNILSSGNRQMIKQLDTLIQSRCKGPAYNQLDKVVEMLDSKIAEGVVDIDFVRGKRRYYKNKIRNCDKRAY